jgi:hypothetical protein
MGAAGDGRAPTEELPCIPSRGFSSRGAAGDGRAPTEELPCIPSRGFSSRGAAGDGPSLFGVRSRAKQKTRNWFLVGSFLKY